MKTLFKIRPHSFIDVITNSSTELYVCDTDKSVEVIEAVLKEIGWPASVTLVTDDTDLESIIDSWGSYHPGLNEINSGDILIEGEDGDGNYTCEIMERIENTFNARRYHLG